tara:strand:- start:138 stop:398 length:261 start_codon:yes stop_codon:yes gene_type:complete
MGAQMNIDLMTGAGSIDIQYCSDAFRYRKKILAFVGRLMDVNPSIRLDRFHLNEDLRIVMSGSFTKYDQNKIVNMIRRLNNKRNDE